MGVFVIALIVFLQVQADKGDPVSCTQNPTKTECQYKYNR